VRSPQRWRWAAAGVFLGATVLARSNAISLFVLLAAPFVGTLPRRQSARNFGAMVVPLLCVLAGWWAYAAATGSRLWPAGNHRNLALTYFASGPDRQSHDALVEAAAPFGSVAEVLLHDPWTIATTYARDAYQNLFHLFAGDGLLAFPLNLLALPGLLLLVGLARRNAVLATVLIAVAAQLLLVNFKAFEPRYFLFLVPVLGAAVAVCWEAIVRSLSGRALRLAAGAAVLLLLAASAVRGARDAHASLHVDSHELAESVPHARAVLPRSAVLMARKPHLGHYTGARSAPIPNSATLDELRAALEAARPERPVFLYYGRAERALRPQLAELHAGDAAPEWLTLVGRSARPGIWALYRVEAGQLATTTPPGEH
jgi:hypothetical protein